MVKIELEHVVFDQTLPLQHQIYKKMRQANYNLEFWRYLQEQIFLFPF